MKNLRSGIFITLLIILYACGNNSNHRSMTQDDSTLKTLKDSLTDIASKCPGEVGIALITSEGDTLVVNNEAKYPLMSVFKLHQALALCDHFERSGKSIDSMVEIQSDRLNPDTWSPMLKEHTGATIVLPVKELLRYTLIQSDNNASNFMFETICSVSETDRFIAKLIPRESFSLSVTEAEMWDNHALCYKNYSSPLGAAELINNLFIDKNICPENRDFICKTLQECETGKDRIVAPLMNKQGVTVAHKTGSGFRDNGILSAHNDVAHVALPDGRYYSLAVLVMDFHGSESEAAKVIANISDHIYSALGRQNTQ